MAKWDAIKKRPLKLIDMFTGYHASQATIHHVLQTLRIDDRFESIDICINQLD